MIVLLPLEDWEGSSRFKWILNKIDLIFFVIWIERNRSTWFVCWRFIHHKFSLLTILSIKFVCFYNFTRHNTDFFFATHWTLLVTSMLNSSFITDILNIDLSGCWQAEWQLTTNSQNVFLLPNCPARLFDNTISMCYLVHLVLCHLCRRLATNQRQLLSS